VDTHAPPEDVGDQLFGGRLSRAAGDGDYGDREPLQPRSRDLEQRFASAGDGDDARAGESLLGRELAEDAAGATFQRLVDEGMPVLLLAPQTWRESV